MRSGVQLDIYESTDESFITLMNSKLGHLRCMTRHVRLSTLEISRLIRGSVVEQDAVESTGIILIRQYWYGTIKSIGEQSDRGLLRYALKKTRDYLGIFPNMGPP